MWTLLRVLSHHKYTRSVPLSVFFLIILRHWKVQIPTGDASPPVPRVGQLSCSGMCSDELISVQLHWKWEQLCGSIAAWPLSSTPSVPHFGKRIPIPSWEGGSSQGDREQSVPCPGHVLPELPWAHPCSGSISISKRFHD